MMNPSDMNIDFLLGLGSNLDGISPASPSSAETSGPLFVEMLNDLLMSYPGAVSRPVADADGQSPSQFGKLFELPNNPDAGKSGEPAVPINKGLLPDVSPTRLPEMQPASNTESQPKQVIPDIAPNLIAGLKETPAPTDRPIVSTVPTADVVQAVVGENVSAFNNDIRAQLPAHALPMENTAIRMNLAVPTNLEAGSYEVIESSQSDSTLKLKLADPSTRDGFIKVELPIERLASTDIGSRSERSEQPVSVKRVEFDSMPKQTTNVERLFAQLNLKQIEVRNVTVDGSSTSNHVAIKLSGVRNGADVQLKAELPQDQLTTLKVEPQPSPKVEAGGKKQPVSVSAKATNNAGMQNPGAVRGVTTNRDSFDEQFLASRQKPAVEPKHAAGQEATEASQSNRARATAAQSFAPTPAPKIRNANNQTRSGRVVAADNARSNVPSTPQAAATAENDHLLTTFSQSLKQSQSAANKIVSSVVRQTTTGYDISTFGGETEQADPFANLDSARETSKTLTSKLSQREVRFSLPDDLASMLKPNGRSVMIRIQPDHLGPARLSLKMHQDKLSARITVETVEIKAVVEQSLDRLTQQLSKSGIDVERIEVALDGRQSGEQLSERHPHWWRQARPTHFDENNITDTDEISSVAPVPTATDAYIGAGGVNVLA